MANAILDELDRRRAASGGAPAQPAVPPSPTVAPQERTAAQPTPLSRPIAPVSPVADVAGETIQASRPAFLATGSMVGGALGAAAGPPGIVAGAAMGTMAANAAFNLTMDAARLTGVRNLPPPKAALDRLDESVREGFIDAAFGLGIPALGQLARGGRAMLLKAGGATDEMLDEARRASGVFGVDLAPTNFEEFRFGRFFSKVIGKLPFVRKPLERSFLAQGRQLAEAQEFLFARVGPTSNLADLGMDMNFIVDRRFAVFRRYMNMLYGRARRMADDTFIPTEHFRRGAQDLRDALVGKFGDLTRGTNPSHPSVRFLRELEQMIAENPQTVPFNRFDGLSIKLDDIRNVAKNDGVATTHLTQFDGQYMDSAMTNLWRQTGADAAERPMLRPANDVREAFAQADGTYGRLAAEFQTPTARRLERIAPRRFRPGLTQPGTRNPDEAMNIVLNKSGEESPQAMRDLRGLLSRSPGTFDRAARAQLDKAWAKAIDTSNLRFEQGLANGELTIDAFRKQLGLDNPQGLRYAATQEMLRTSGVPIERLAEFTNLMQKVAASAPDDLNVFLGRRVAIGGVRGLINALVPGAVVSGAGGGQGPIQAAGAGILGGIASVVGMRHMSKIVSDPRTFDIVSGLYNTVLDDTVRFARRRAAVIGIVRVLEPDATPAAQEQAAAVTMLPNVPTP